MRKVIVTILLIIALTYLIYQAASWLDHRMATRREAVPMATPPPVLYKMFDYGTDSGFGSVHWYLWEDLNPAPGQYDWSPVERNLEKERGLTVTLPDGEIVAKPVMVKLIVSLSRYNNWSGYYDGTPEWVYRYNDIGESLNNHPVGHVLGQSQAVPAYDSRAWRRANHDFVRAFAERYDDDAQIVAMVVTTGLDGETQIAKDPWMEVARQIGGLEYGFGKYVKSSMRTYAQSFAHTPVYIENATGGSGMRKMIGERAARLNIGLKHSGMWTDLDSHQGYGNFVGSWDMIDEYSTTLPIWIESAYGFGSEEQKYWSWLAGLHYHPDAMDVHPDWLTDTDPGTLRWVTEHLGVSIHDTPSVWTAFRDAEYPVNMWTDTDGCSGKQGDWQFWLYRLDGGILVRDIAAPGIYSRQARKITDTMTFDVADGFCGEAIVVTHLDRGTDMLALEYDGVSWPIRKGGTNRWITHLWFTPNLCNDSPTEWDFRLSSEGDGDEIVHFVEVLRIAPTPTILPTATLTAIPTSTPTNTPTHTVTPTNTPTPEPYPSPETLKQRLSKLETRTMQQRLEIDTLFDLVED